MDEEPAGGVPAGFAAGTAGTTCDGSVPWKQGIGSPGVVSLQKELRKVPELSPRGAAQLQGVAGRPDAAFGRGAAMQEGPHSDPGGEVLPHNPSSEVARQVRDTNRVRKRHKVLQGRLLHLLHSMLCLPWETQCSSMITGRVSKKAQPSTGGHLTTMSGWETFTHLRP